MLRTLLVLSLFLPGVMPAKTPQTITLEGAIQAALSQNPRLRQAEFEVQAAQAQVAQARYRFFPQVDAGGLVKQGLSGSGNLFGLHGLASSPEPDDAAFSLNVYQDIFDFGRSRHAKLARQLELASFQEAARFERAQIVRDVTAAYFAVLKAQLNIKQGESKRALKALGLRRSRALQAAELVSGLQVTQAETRLAESEQDLESRRGDLRQALANLRNVIGAEDFAFDSVEATEVKEQPPPPLNFWLGQRDQRADLKAVDRQIEAQEEWVNQAEKERRPRFMGIFSGGWTRFANLTAGRLLFGGLGLRLPVFTGKRLKAQIEEARNYLEKRKSQRQELVQKIEFQIEDSYLEVNQLVAMAGPLRDHVLEAQQALQLAQLRRQAQLADAVEVAQAESKLVDARSRLAEILYDYEITKSSLEFAAGGPTP